MLGLTLKIALAVGALVVGIWLGMPGRYTQNVAEIEETMERGGGRRKKVKRLFTPTAWVRRQATARSERRTAGQAKRFRLESPDDR